MEQLLTWSYGLLCFLLGGLCWNEVKKYIEDHTDSFYKRKTERLRETIEELVDVMEEVVEDDE